VRKSPKMKPNPYFLIFKSKFFLCNRVTTKLGNLKVHLKKLPSLNNRPNGEYGHPGLYICALQIVDRSDRSSENRVTYHGHLHKKTKSM
jgi:hypothetical protein